MEIKKPELFTNSNTVPRPENFTESPSKKPGMLIFALVVLGFLVALALYLSFAKAAMGTAQKQLEDEITSLESQIQTLKDQNVEAAQFAAAWLSQIEKDEIRWSKVINSVQDLIPLDVTTQKPKIKFLSYSGAAGGKLTLNAQTIEGSALPFNDVAELLEVFNSSSFFKDAYIPSITRGLTEKGDPVLSFAFIVNYYEQLIDTLPQIQNVPGNTSPPDAVDISPPADTPTKVPRKAS